MRKYGSSRKASANDTSDSSRSSVAECNRPTRLLFRHGMPCHLRVYSNPGTLEIGSLNGPESGLKVSDRGLVRKPGVGIPPCFTHAGNPRHPVQRARMDLFPYSRDGCSANIAAPRVAPLDITGVIVGRLTDPRP